MCDRNLSQCHNAKWLHRHLPGESRVVQLFGTYKGTIRITGFGFTYPLSSRKKVSVRVRNFETNETKVNDYSGNPINIAAIVVWQVADTAKAQFSVENYVEFIKSQSESALRHIATQHPYDFPVDGRSSLRGSTEDISIELANEVAERVSVAGLEIVETRISSLSYAPEIAQAMLQRQQAAAIVDARETIVDGAVSMVEMALDQLEQKISSILIQNDAPPWFPTCSLFCVLTARPSQLSTLAASTSNQHTDKMAQRKAISLRLDPAVHDAIARWAEDDLRSVNAQIEVILRDGLRRAGRLPTSTGKLPKRGRPPKIQKRTPKRRRKACRCL